MLLENTNITSLPPEIGYLTKLKTLKISFAITTLPPEIGQLTALEELVIEGKAMKVLPPEFGHLDNLWKLDLNKTSIPIPIQRLLAHPEGRHRYANYPAYLSTKIQQNLPLDATDQEYPWYARYAPVLEPLCAQYPTATAQEVKKLILKQQAPVENETSLR